MVPMSQVFDRFPRMVRDLGKEAEFEMLGRDVEAATAFDQAFMESMVDTQSDEPFFNDPAENSKSSYSCDSAFPAHDPAAGQL